MVQRDISPKAQEVLDTERAWMHEVNTARAEERADLAADSIEAVYDEDDGDAG